MSGLRTGDQARVTIEAEVWAKKLDGSAVELRVVDKDGFYRYLSVDPATVEKVEPPVEVFKPGDVVRWRAGRGEFRYDEYDRALGQDGYVLIGTGTAAGRHYRYGEHAGHPKSYFTSEHFERVEV